MKTPKSTDVAKPVVKSDVVASIQLLEIDLEDDEFKPLFLEPGFEGVEHPGELGEITAQGIELGGQLLRSRLELADLAVARLELEEELELFAHLTTFRFACHPWAHLGSNQGPTGYEPAALTV